MKRAILISTVAALTLTGGAALAFGKDRMGGHFGGPRGEMFNFEEMDTNADGKITKEEIAAHFKARFDAADTDKDGTLSAEEIVAQRQQQMADRMARQAKHMIVDRDANDDGKLSLEEMQPKQQGKMFDRLDADKDGAISAEEMAQMQNKMQKRMGGKDDRMGHGDRMMRHGGDGHGWGKGEGKGDCQRQRGQ